MNYMCVCVCVCMEGSHGCGGCMDGVVVDVPMCMEWDRMGIYVYDECVRMWMNVESSWGAQELACPLLLVLFVVVVGAALVVGGF